MLVIFTDETVQTNSQRHPPGDNGQNDILRGLFDARIGSFMPAAAAAPLAWGEVQFLLKQARKIMFILETRLHGDFFDRELAFGQEITGANQPELEQVLVRT